MFGKLGFLGALTILFIGLKLTGYIDWSWILVTSPMWGTSVCWLVVSAFCLAMAGLQVLLSKR